MQGWLWLMDDKRAKIVIACLAMWVTFDWTLFPIILESLASWVWDSLSRKSNSAQSHRDHSERAPLLSVPQQSYDSSSRRRTASSTEGICRPCSQGDISSAIISNIPNANGV